MLPCLTVNRLTKHFVGVSIGLRPWLSTPPMGHRDGAIRAPLHPRHREDGYRVVAAKVPQGVTLPQGSPTSPSTKSG